MSLSDLACVWGGNINGWNRIAAVSLCGSHLAVGPRRRSGCFGALGVGPNTEPRVRKSGGSCKPASQREGGVFSRLRQSSRPQPLPPPHPDIADTDLCAVRKEDAEVMSLGKVSHNHVQLAPRRVRVGWAIAKLGCELVQTLVTVLLLQDSRSQHPQEGQIRFSIGAREEGPRQGNRPGFASAHVQIRLCDVIYLHLVAAVAAHLHHRPPCSPQPEGQLHVRVDSRHGVGMGQCRSVRRQS